MLLAALLLLQTTNLIAGDERVRAPQPEFPYTSNAGIDLGCVGGGLEGSSFPAQIYDAAHHEWISYNVSRCTGGYIHARNDATGRSWRISIAPGGGLSGTDAQGARWTYQRARKLYVNQATHASCVAPDYRAMCSG